MAVMRAVARFRSDAAPARLVRQSQVDPLLQSPSNRLPF
jgi:hypothetical protein